MHQLPRTWRQVLPLPIKPILLLMKVTLNSFMLSK